jgi:hypothetical protein
MRWLPPLVATVAFAAPAAAQTPAPNALLAQENAVWQAIVDHRPDAFAGFLDRDYVGVYGFGFRTAAQETDDIRGINLVRFQISDFVVRGVDASDLVVTYRVDISGNAQGHDFAGRYNVASYWHRSGRQWRVQLHSQTQVSS